MSRSAPRGLALAGLLLVLPWGLFTMIEIDRGWEDAIWQYNPWRRDAIVLTWIGLAAALDANITAESRARALAWTALGLEVAAGLAWMVLLFTTPS
jgi:hypothetical protein